MDGVSAHLRTTWSPSSVLGAAEEAAAAVARRVRAATVWCVWVNRIGFRQYSGKFTHQSAPRIDKIPVRLSYAWLTSWRTSVSKPFSRAMARARSIRAWSRAWLRVKIHRPVRERQNRRE